MVLRIGYSESLLRLTYTIRTMSDNAGRLSQAGKFSGTVRGKITRLEEQISKPEDKPDIASNDSLRIQAHTEKFISLDSNFKTHHFYIIELVDKEAIETMKRKQSILDDHEDRMN